MNVRQIQDFAAVVEYGGIRAAARALGVSQAGLAHAIKRFEADCNVVLFERSPRGFILTPQGNEIYLHAQAILREIALADVAVRRMNGSAQGFIDVGMSIDPALSIGYRVMDDFQKRFPDTVVRVNTGPSESIIPALMSGLLDVAVSRIPASFTGSRVSISVLYEEETIIVSRKGLEIPEPLSWQKLVRWPWVVIGNPAKSAIDDGSFHDIFEAHGLATPRSVVICNALFDAITMLCESDRLTRLPRAILDHRLAKSLLQAVPLQMKLPSHQVAILYRADKPLSIEVKTFIAMVSSFSRIQRHHQQSPP